VDWVFGAFQSLKPNPDEHRIQPIEASQLDRVFQNIESACRRTEAHDTRTSVQPAHGSGIKKIHYRKAEGSTPTSYTMDHSAGKYVFDTYGAVRLFSSYSTEPAVIAEVILTLLRSMKA
jgi:cytochrome oxidase Cu insertion factor (SCO1/SenC/PrrC family)